ncbi:MAG: CoA transferase [Alphaproteobacteria bacterium]|nr:CoA transferase [Alphaproteobacteria bacterium]
MSGPFCTMMLADLGAQVTKIEDIEGTDVTRHNHPFVGGESHYYVSVNRNKESVSLNLKSEEGRRIARELAIQCDIVVENFRPGVMKRLGLDYETLKAKNPRLIFCSLSAFGQTGPLRDKIAYDLVIQALTGAMAVTGEPGRPPVKMGLPLADEVSGMFAAIGILAALEQRERSGEGCVLDIAMFDVGLTLLSYMANIYFANGSSPERLGSAHPTIYPYNGFETSDGYLVAAPFTQAFWRKFAVVVGQDELPNNPKFKTFSDRLKNRAELESILNPILKTRPTAEWLGRLDEGDVPNGQINSVGAALEMEQTKHRKMVVEVEHPTAGKIKSLGTPFHFRFENKAEYQPHFRAAPLLGQDTEAVLSQRLNMPAQDISTLAERGVVRCNSMAGAANRRLQAPQGGAPAAKAPPAANAPAGAGLPLAGLRVLDLTRMLAGPMGCLIFAELGAEVIKIEEPRIGDPTRRNLPFVGTESAYYMAVNRGKDSICLDLKSVEGHRVFLDLVAKSDVVVENFRPGVMGKLGLSYADLRAVKPDIILCSISGFGQTGPLREKISFDLVNQAIAGTMAVTGEDGRPPARIGVPAGDLCGGIFGALATLAALRARRTTGLGAHVDMSLHDSLVSLLGYLAQSYLITGQSPKSVGSGHHNIVPYRAYEGTDGHFVVAAFSQEFWAKLARAIGRPELVDDPRFRLLANRKENRDALNDILEPIFRTGSVTHWIETLEANDVPCAPIWSVGRALDSEQSAAREMTFDLQHSTLGVQRTLGMPFRCNGKLWRSLKPPPTLGQQSEQILTDLLGYSAEQVRHVLNSTEPV